MQLAILIPTVNRAEKLKPLLENIAAVTLTPHRVYLVVENSDRETAETLPDLPDHIAVFGDFGGYPAAINAGYLATTEPYFLCCNDDVRFTEGWDTALDKMVPPVQVVGINQGDGRTESFALVDRSYISGQSGVFDKPNTVLHPYQSQFCDDEFADLAKQRGIWADAPDAVIEHRHWTKGQAPMDDNYRKAKASFDADKATYERRRREWAAS